MQRRKAINPIHRQWSAWVLMITGTALLALSITLAAPAVAQNEPPGPTPLPLYALPDSRLSRTASSNAIALADDNRTLVAANTLNNTISIILPTQGKLVAEIPVGHDPRTLAFYNTIKPSSPPIGAMVPCP